VHSWSLGSHVHSPASAPLASLRLHCRHSSRPRPSSAQQAHRPDLVEAEQPTDFVKAAETVAIAVVAAVVAATGSVPAVAVEMVLPMAVKSVQAEVSAAEVEHDAPPAVAPTCVQAG